MKTVGNVLWLIFIGWENALVMFFVGLLCCATIILIPVGIQIFKYASLWLWPIGKRVDLSGGIFKTFVNILWLILFGWIVALYFLLAGVSLCCTLIGIPFGIQFFKFAKLSLMPLGAKIN